MGSRGNTDFRFSLNFKITYATPAEVWRTGKCNTFFCEHSQEFRCSDAEVGWKQNIWDIYVAEGGTGKN